LNPLIFFIVFLGAFTQSLTGFGSALVAMALLPPLLGIRVAAPLVAGTFLCLEGMMVIRYRDSIRVDAVWRMLTAALLGAPLGVYLLGHIEERIALIVLGAVISGYALYALVGFHLPELSHPLWAWAAGLVSGMLGGAYNTSGPPAVIYGSCRRWSAQEFKSNLSGFFVINSVLVVASHLAGGNFSEEVWHLLPPSLFAMMLGFLAGQWLDRWISPPLFKRMVLILLAVLGARLLLQS
jgi:uncharacterized membrane protein YfcA